jgi:hypothetical protein
MTNRLGLAVRAAGGTGRAVGAYCGGRRGTPPPQRWPPGPLAAIKTPTPWNQPSSPLGRAGLPHPRLLPRGRAGRPLRRLGRTRAVRERDPGRVPDPAPVVLCQVGERPDAQGAAGIVRARQLCPPSAPPRLMRCSPYPTQSAAGPSTFRSVRCGSAEQARTVPVDRIDSLVFYLPDTAARERLMARMAAAGLEPASQHPTGRRTGA